MKAQWGIVVSLVCMTLAGGASASEAAEAEPAPQKVLWPAKYIQASKSCLFNIVTEKMNVQPVAEKPLPEVKIEGDVSMAEYQDAAQEFWGVRPDVFVNFFQPMRNKIFLMADAEYYLKRQRSPFDSLVHEMVHAIQFLYKQADFANDPMDQLEAEAVRVQTWFRETYGSNVQDWQFECPESSMLIM